MKGTSEAALQKKSKYFYNCLENFSLVKNHYGTKQG